MNEINENKHFMIEFIPGLLLGMGLSAAVGFRIFVPFLFMSLAGKFGLMEMSAGMDWMATTPALVAFATATIFEIGGYFIPWIDNLLDTVTTPAAFIGGTVMMSSAIIEMDPLMQWSLAIIAGGGTAGLIKGGSATTRLASTATTGGVANPLVSSVETMGAIGLSVFAVFVPALCGIIVLLLLCYTIYRLIKWRNRRKSLA